MDDHCLLLYTQDSEGCAKDEGRTGLNYLRSNGKNSSKPGCRDGQAQDVAQRTGRTSGTHAGQSLHSEDRQGQGRAFLDARGHLPSAGLSARRHTGVSRGIENTLVFSVLIHGNYVPLPANFAFVRFPNNYELKNYHYHSIQL